MSDLPPQYGMDRQFQIYMGGLQGQRPTLPLSYDALEAAAQAALSPEAFGYVAGGAGSEDTMRANREAFARWRIIPRMLRNVGVRDHRVQVLGTTFAAPVMLAPSECNRSCTPRRKWRPRRRRRR